MLLSTTDYNGVTSTYTYDVYNRLTGYTDGSHKESYTYDAESVRRSKTNGEESLIFISDTTGSLSQTLAETDEEGNLIAAYTRADTLISQVRDGEVSYYLYDGHGDVRALSDDKGNITDRYRYNAYGELLEKEGDTENHYLYTGEYYDGASDLYYLRARYMNPSTGTFISMDTYEGSIYDPDTLHKYLYANGNPVTYSDPSGNMFSIAEGAISAGIQSVFNNMVQIMYNGVISGLVNMIFTCVMGGSFKETMSSFVTGFIIGAGISAIRYFVVGAKLVTLARFYVLSATASFIFNTTITIFAITQGLPELAVMSGVLAVLSLAEWCYAYGNYLLVDVYGDNGGARIEIGSSGESGSTDAVPGTSKLIGAGEGEKFGTYASKATPVEGYTDVIVHGAPPNKVGVMHNGEWVYLDHRSLANYLKQDVGYSGGPIRLLSCGTGATSNGFAQNLSNKMGVVVMAPSDTVWAFPNGKLTIGSNAYSNTGQWNIFIPGNH